MPTILFKPTMRCNANCRYCHAAAPDRYAAAIMPDHILETLFTRIDDFLRESPGERVDLVWHGGEPTLLPPKYYSNVLDLQNRLCPKTHWRIRHSLQSNLTALTEDHLEVFRKLGIKSISTSYDPIPGIRGRRVNGGVDWEGYDRAFLRSLHLLDRKGFSWAVIYVAHRLSLERPLDIYRFLLNISGGRIMINPVDIFDDDPDGLSITPEQFADFLGAIFPVWWSERHIYPDVKPFKLYTDTILDGKTRMMCTDGGKCSETHLYVAPDGSTSLCCMAADFDFVLFGNIRDRSIGEIFRDSKRGQIRMRNVSLPKGDCQGCRFWGLCHGGCPMRAYAQHEDFARKSKWCAFRTRFMEKYFEPVTGVRYGENRQVQVSLT